MGLVRVAFLSLSAGAVGVAATRGPVAWQASAEEVETGLIAELAPLVRGGPHRLEAALEPIYSALPKNAHGRLESQAVSAALRRVFLQRPGWTLRGLDAGDAEAFVPSYLQKLVTDRTNELGVGLRELASMAGTLEELSRKEATARLEQAYGIVGLPLTGSADRDEVLRALRLYAEAYLSSNASSAVASKWLQRLQPEALLAASAPSFHDASQAALAMDRQMSRFNAGECSGLSPSSPEPTCFHVSSLYMLCCGNGETAPADALEPSIWEDMWAEFPALCILSLVCFSLSALVTIGRWFCGCPSAAAAPEAATTEGVVAESAAEEVCDSAAGQGLKPLASCLAWCLLCGLAVAADLLDVAVIAPALVVGLALVAAARLAPKQPAKAKKI